MSLTWPWALLALLAFPVIYAIDLGSLQPSDPTGNALGLTDGNVTLAATLALAAAGLLVAVATLHLARGIALGHGALIRGLLGMSKAQVDLSLARSEVATQSARAERSEQSRRELIVNVSHELRTPIASIRGHVESLLDPHGGKPSEEDTQRYLAIVQKETERLGSLVDDLLAVARADAHELRLDGRDLVVADVTRPKLVARLEVGAESHRHVALAIDVLVSQGGDLIWQRPRVSSSSAQAVRRWCPFGTPT